jgi:uncharacterized protein
MKKNNPLMQPLSEQEINWLEDYLDNLSKTYENTMSLEKVDGLFCALMINPISAKPAEWLEVIFDKDFKFESEQEGEKIFNLLFRHWNHVSYLIRHPPRTEQDDFYFPLIADYDKDNSTHKLAEQWAIGFRIGMNYCIDEWDDLINDKESYTLFVPIILLELGYNPDNEEIVVTDEEREYLIDMIPAVVYKIFDFWQAKNKKSKASNIKIGRNDPCPCGSGKKYKKCCAGTVSETIH